MRSLAQLSFDRLLGEVGGFVAPSALSGTSPVRRERNSVLGLGSFVSIAAGRRRTFGPGRCSLRRVDFAFVRPRREGFHIAGALHRQR
jgi:hypothetical protein